MKTRWKPLVNWVAQGRCQNGPSRLIPLPESPNLDTRPCLPLLCLPLLPPPPSNTGPSRGTCMPKLARSQCPNPRHDHLEDTATSTRGGTPPLPPLPSEEQAYHSAYHHSTPAQYPSPQVFACPPACMPPTGGQPKTDGPQPVTSVCYLFDLARGLDTPKRPAFPCTHGTVARAGGGGRGQGGGCISLPRPVIDLSRALPTLPPPVRGHLHTLAHPPATSCMFVARTIAAAGPPPRSRTADRYQL